jgi:dihydrofolate reductase
MGGCTREWIDDHSAWPYGDVPAYVISSTLPEGRAEHATIMPGPPGDLAATVRDGEGTVWLEAGGSLFTAAGLVDLGIVTVIPVMLGAGVPLPPARGEACQRLELAETRTLPGGCVQLHYRPKR